MPPVLDVPSDDDVEQAKSLLLEEWLGDFPFAEESSRSHAVAALLSHILRNRIDGPTSLSSPSTLLPPAPARPYSSSRSVIVATGASPAAMSLPTQGRRPPQADHVRPPRLERPLVLLDNVTHTLESGVLAATLTSRTWSDRLLGKSETVSVPNSCLWIATGNNLQLGSEIAQAHRLGSPRPQGRPPLGAHRLQARSARPLGCRESRSAALGGLRSGQAHWLAAGSSSHGGRRPLGSFESWCRVVGGILDSAAIPGFLDNRAELYRQVDQESEEWRAFTQAWWSELIGTGPVKARRAGPPRQG